MIRLVALDIDGTLLEPGVHVDTLPSNAISRAIRDLIDAGIVVVLATGRMYPGTVYVANHLGISQPLICQQGASVHYLDGRLQHGCTIEEEIALELIQFAESHEWPLAWFDSERYLVTSGNEAALFFAQVSRVDMEIHPQPHKSGVRATGIDIISTREHSTDVHRLLEARYGARITLLDFPSVTAVHAPQASKGNAVNRLASDLGIKQTEVLAIGDSINDVSMLSWAGHSSAPQHCDPYARESAKEILEGDGVDGVAAKLRSVIA